MPETGACETEINTDKAEDGARSPTILLDDTAGLGEQCADEQLPQEEDDDKPAVTESI